MPGETVLDLSVPSKLLWKVSEPVYIPLLLPRSFISPVSFPKIDIVGLYIFGHLSDGSLLYF